MTSTLRLTEFLKDILEKDISANAVFSTLDQLFWSLSTPVRLAERDDDLPYQELETLLARAIQESGGDPSKSIVQPADIVSSLIFIGQIHTATFMNNVRKHRKKIDD